MFNKEETKNINELIDKFNYIVRRFESMNQEYYNFFTLGAGQEYSQLMKDQEKTIEQLNCVGIEITNTHKQIPKMVEGFTPKPQFMKLLIYVIDYRNIESSQKIIPTYDVLIHILSVLENNIILLCNYSQHISYLSSESNILTVEYEQIIGMYYQYLMENALEQTNENILHFEQYILEEYYHCQIIDKYNTLI